MENSWIGFLAFIATFIIGRWISERALKLLSDEERGRLIKGLTKYRIFSLIGVVVLVVIYYASQSLSPDSLIAKYSVFVGVLVFYLLGNTLYAYKKLKDFKMPDKYVNQFLLSTFIQYVGLFVFFGTAVNAK